MTTLPCNSDGENLECKRLTEMGGDEPLLTYGWKWEPTCTVDENYYDLCSLVTRNSSCIQGQVGCVIVSGLNDDAGRLHCSENGFRQGHIVTMVTNSALLKHRQSNCHAEANAVCWCARRGVPMEGCSAYVTIPPCNKCSMLLIMAGVQRIVSCLQGNMLEDCSMHSATLRYAKACGVSVVHVPDTEERHMRRVLLGKMNEDRNTVLELRRERAQLRKEEKQQKKQQLSSAGN